MSLESQALTDSITKLQREKAQIVPFIQNLQTQLATAVTELATAIANGASDKEIADAARLALPLIDDTVTALDAFTPEGTPVVPTV